MDVAMDLDMELDHQANTSAKPVKRFGLSSSIQTNFGDDYIFQIAAKDDWSSIAVSLSTNDVKLYSPHTGQYLGECKGHLGTIHQIGFCVPSIPHLLHSCSSDGTVRSWDTRTYQQVSCLSAGSYQEIFCFSHGGSSDNILAAGSKSQILFWDWRSNKPVASLDDSHVDDVTQVSFIPGHPSRLLSASVDGLMCIFNIGGDINEDENLDSVMNVGTSIGKVGFFGESKEKLWCLTHIESLSIWDWSDSRLETDMQEARSLASRSWSMDAVDYFVDCHTSTSSGHLWVVGGANSGAIGYFPVNWRGGEIGSPEAVLVGGHTGVVRSVLSMPESSRRRGIFGWSGGEDGRLCCWSSDDSWEKKRAWISSALVMKSPKGNKKSRHHPY